MKQLVKDGMNHSTIKQKLYIVQKSIHMAFYHHHTTAVNTYVAGNYPFNYHTICGGNIPILNYLDGILYHHGTIVKYEQMFTMWKQLLVPVNHKHVIVRLLLVVGMIVLIDWCWQNVLLVINAKIKGYRNTSGLVDWRNLWQNIR